VGEESFELNPGVVAMPKISSASRRRGVQMMKRKKGWRELWQEGGGEDSRAREGAQRSY
jgi:hypothetical protein